MEECGVTKKDGTSCTILVSKGKPCQYHGKSKPKTTKTKEAPKKTKTAKKPKETTQKTKTTKAVSKKPTKPSPKKSSPKPSPKKPSPEVVKATSPKPSSKTTLEKASSPVPKIKRPKGRPKGSKTKPKGSPKPKRPKGRPKGSKTKPKGSPKSKGSTETRPRRPVKKIEESVESSSEELSFSESDSSDFSSSESPGKVIVKSKPKKLPKAFETSDCLKGIKQLHDYQEKAVNFIRNNRGLIAWWQTGSGKTLLATVSSRCYLQDVPDGVVIFISSLTLQDNFIKELKAEKVNMKTVVKFNKDMNLRDIREKGYRYILVQYTPTLAKFVSAWKKIGDQKFMIIVDEAHNAKSGEGTRFKPLERLCRGTSNIRPADKVLLLTATPVYNEPYDIEPLLALAEGRKVVSRKIYDAMCFNAEKMKKHVRCRISIQDGERDPNDYPSYKEHEVFIDMSDEYLKEYRKICPPDQPASSFKTAERQASNIQINDVENPKIKWIVDFFKKQSKYNEIEKTLVYSNFVVNGIEKVKAILNKLKIPNSEVQGKVSSDERTKAVNDFNSGKVKVMFITKAGGEGLDLKGVRHVINLESGWTRSGEEQVLGRAVRYKSHSHLPLDQRHVDIYHLMLKKPENKLIPGELQSSDVILTELKRKKQTILENFKKVIRHFSIEDDPSCLKTRRSRE